MTLHLVCLKLGIPHEVLVTPQGFKIADLDSGERGKALISGPPETGPGKMLDFGLMEMPPFLVQL